MRRIRIAGLCLVAIFAMSAVVSATASAEAPEFGQCLKIAKGTEKKLSLYDSSKCIKQAGEDTGTEAEKLKKANYEWFPGAVAGDNTFATKGGVATLLTVKGESVTCESEESTGEYVVGGNNKEELTTVTFKKCQSGGLTCTTEGKAPGELVTNPLTGIVGFEKTPGAGFTARKTDLQLHPTAAGTHFIDFKCTAALTIEVRGHEEGKNGILVPIKNDAMKFEETLKYVQSKGIQKPVKWFPPAAGYSESQFLESNFQKTGFAQSGQTVTSKVKNTGSKKYELNAFV
jgi:hypothetical protein